MKYIRTKDGIFELKKYEEKYHYFKVNGSAYKLQKISECSQADTIEDLIQPGDIIFYFDFHSQKEQCMYLNYILGIKDINITKLLIPFGDDYRCVAKAEHEYHQFDSMKQVVKKGELELL